MSEKIPETSDTRIGCSGWFPVATLEICMINEKICFVGHLYIQCN